MGSVNFKVLIRYYFQCSIKMRVFDVLHHLVTYLWTKRYKCCIKSANYVMLTYVRLSIVGLLKLRHLSCYNVDSLAFVIFCECFNLMFHIFILTALPDFSLVEYFFADVVFTPPPQRIFT